MSAQHRQLAENALLVTREETFTNVGTEDNRCLVSLDSVGMDDVAYKKYEAQQALREEA